MFLLKTTPNLYLLSFGTMAFFLLVPIAAAIISRRNSKKINTQNK